MSKFTYANRHQCDGEKPTCRNCESKGRICHYKQSDDKRKVQVRVAVGLLARRVDNLVQYIKNSGLPVPRLDNQDYMVLKNIFEILELSCNDLNSDPGPAANGVDGRSPAGIEDDDTHQGIPSTDDHSHSVRDSLQVEEHPVETAAHEECHLGRTPTGITNNPGTHQEAVNAASFDQLSSMPAQTQKDPVVQAELDDTGIDSDDEVTDRFSCRLGRLQLTHDGQLRYFGSTSNLTLLDALVDATPPITVQKDVSELLENAKLDREADEILERHLLELFFTWQDPSMHVVDAEAFWCCRAQSKHEEVTTLYYSRALADAMCALGAAYEPRYHPEFLTFPRSLAEFFGDRAKLLLELELDSPSIATVQALVIVSNHEAYCKRDTRGWLYSGMYLAQHQMNIRLTRPRNGNATGLRPWSPS